MVDASFLLEKYGWKAIDELDNWLYIFDKLPPKMKLIVDLAISGMKPKEITKQLKCSYQFVYDQLAEAKKRIIEGENLPYKEEWGNENVEEE